MKYIFLDFDGVLHRSNAKSNPMFEHMDLFCNFISQYKDSVRIVISSSWKDTFKLQNIKDFFPDDVAAMIEGVTPSIKHELNAGSREKEIRSYLADKDIADNDWIALDDMPLLFLNHNNVVFTNPKEGITQKELELIKLFIENKPKKNTNYTL